MSYEKKHYVNSGSIGVNQRKEIDNHPDRSGSVNITCPKCQRESQFWISGWLKEGNDGSKFMSLSFKEKVPKGQQRDPDPKPSKPYTPGPIDPPRAKDEDDVPF